MIAPATDLSPLDSTLDVAACSSGSDARPCSVMDTDAAIEEHAARLVADAPPLSDDQRSRLAALLANGKEVRHGTE